ncbi:unnamed protein product [Boreogadus saida]
MHRIQLMGQMFAQCATPFKPPSPPISRDRPDWAQVGRAGISGPSPQPGGEGLEDDAEDGDRSLGLTFDLSIEIHLAALVPHPNVCPAPWSPGAPSQRLSCPVEPGCPIPTSVLPRGALDADYRQVEEHVRASCLHVETFRVWRSDAEWHLSSSPQRDFLSSAPPPDCQSLRAARAAEM